MWFFSEVQTKVHQLFVCGCVYERETERETIFLCDILKAWDHLPKSQK